MTEPAPFRFVSAAPQRSVAAVVAASGVARVAVVLRDRLAAVAAARVALDFRGRWFFAAAFCERRCGQTDGERAGQDDAGQPLRVIAFIRFLLVWYVRATASARPMSAGCHASRTLSVLRHRDRTMPCLARPVTSRFRLAPRPISHVRLRRVLSAENHRAVTYTSRPRRFVNHRASVRSADNVGPAGPRRRRETDVTSAWGYVQSGQPSVSKWQRPHSPTNRMLT